MTLQPNLLLTCALMFASASAWADTSTSTQSVQFPEDGGAMPRADMPQGGTSTEWRKSPDAPATQPAEGDEPSLLDKFSFGFDGYIRVLGRIIENDDLAFVGRNDGFRLANVRLGASVRYGEDLEAYVSIEAAAQQGEGENDPNVELGLDLRDAYIRYEIAPMVDVSLGRFKAPYDLGELEATRARIFIDAPVSSKGVARTEGLETRGLSQGRQIGLMLHKDRLGLTDDGIDIGFQLALTNGATRKLAFNDNDRPAAFARVSLHYGKFVSINAGGFLDIRTEGTLPNRFDEELKGLEGSLSLDFGSLGEYTDLRIEGQFLFQHTDFVTTMLEASTAMGIHGQWAYKIWDIEVAYRFAYLEPDSLFDPDVIIEHTIAVSYLPSQLPLKISINGTMADEERPVDNNRLDFLAQFVF